MKFHITITDNETGNIICDTDTDAVIASIHTEETTQAICSTNCNLPALCNTISAYLDIGNKLKEKEAFAYMIAEASIKNRDIETTEENTEE